MTFQNIPKLCNQVQNKGKNITSNQGSEQKIFRSYLKSA